jgi:uncharacterized protein YegP (UPF0339 family)
MQMAESTYRGILARSFDLPEFYDPSSRHEEELRLPAPRDPVKVQEDNQGRWYWELVDENGHVIASSARHFETEAACINEIFSIFEADVVISRSSKSEVQFRKSTNEEIKGL